MILIHRRGATVTGDNLTYKMGTVSVFQPKESIVSLIAKTHGNDENKAMK
ncbi:hypothetical protein LRS05_00210 [Flavobacterium sp. J372]|nr:hypothetical protein [Flavobacterium sp. J372]MCR5860677.1 hypothetical protein [Flavobacterium sp. J372]